jgi:hypothetical protein
MSSSYFLSTYNAPGTVQGSVGTVGSQADKASTVMEPTIQGQKMKRTQHTQRQGEGREEEAAWWDLKSVLLG